MPTLSSAQRHDHLSRQCEVINAPSRQARNAFTEQFRKWCDAAGLPQRCKPHGLRKAACRRLAEAGCSEKQIAAISGHASLDEVARYTKAADKARLARDAMALMVKAVIR